MATATTNQLTVAGAGSDITTIIDCCNSFLNKNKFEECVNIIRNELNTFISKIIKFLDDTRDLLAKRKMYLIKSYFNSIEKLLDAGPEAKTSLEEHFVKLEEVTKETVDIFKIQLPA